MLQLQLLDKVVAFGLVRRCDLLELALRRFVVLHVRDCLMIEHLLVRLRGVEDLVLADRRAHDMR